MSFFDALLWPIMVVVAWIMVQFHALVTAIGLPPDSGAAWVLSIVGLVVVMRIILIPLFVKQIKASRGLQLLQPQMQKLQAKYKGKTDPASRQAMQQEMMALYRENGTNPFASCLPILAQSPIFFALFRVLYTLPELASGATVNGRTSIGPLTPELAASAEQSTIFGAPLSATFIRADEFPSPTSVRIVSAVLIILMSATTFLTQRQLTMKNMPAAALDNPMARQQRMLMYILPIIFAVTGVNFPIGVLIYWFTTNLWTMGQQFYVIRRMPAPGSEAEAALRARKARRALRRGRPAPEAESTPQDEPRAGGGQRQQPKRKDRQRPGPATGGQGARPPAGGKSASGPRPRTGSDGASGSRSAGAGAGTTGGSGTTGKSGATPGQHPPTGGTRKKRPPASGQTGARGGGGSNTRSTGGGGSTPRAKNERQRRAAGPPKPAPERPSDS